MTIAKMFEIAPKSERTLIKHGYYIAGYHFLNDQGQACEYRVVGVGPREIGLIKYYKGRKLCAYEKVA